MIARRVLYLSATTAFERSYLVQTCSNGRRRPAHGDDGADPLAGDQVVALGVVPGSLDQDVTVASQSSA